MSLRLPSTATIAEVYDALEALSAETGQKAFSRAARALYQQQGGRPRYDDRMAIAEVEDLLASGRAKTLHQALMLVARARGPAGCEKSTTERLRRKFRATRKIHENVKVERRAA